MDYTRIALREPERLWLEEVYQYFKRYERPKQRQIMANLLGRLPRNFDPKCIDRRLLWGTDRITIPGIVAVERNATILEKGDKIIKTIKQLLLQDTGLLEIEIATVAEKCGLSPEETGSIFQLVTHYGHFYESASSFSNDSIAIKTINIGENTQYYQQYYYFEDLGKLIEEYHLEESRQAKELLVKPEEPNVQSESSLEVQPIFHSRIEHVNPSICFVLMPFTLPWSDRVYNKLVRPNIENLGLQAIRADNLNGPIVIEDIWAQINMAGVIIADVTDKNPNVMYELGIVHTLGKPTILLTQDLTSIPFDFKHLRHYPYQDNIDSFESFGKNLQSIVRELYLKHFPNRVLVSPMM